MLDQHESNEQEPREMQVEATEEIYIKPPCRLHDFTSDFEVLISPDGYKAKTRREAGFEWLWKSVKTNYGVFNGKYYFEVRILSLVEADKYSGSLANDKNYFTKTTMDDPAFSQKHLCRIGWSTYNALSNLGFDYEGCGYDSNGFKTFGAKEANYGESFEVGDVIRCCIDLDNGFIISYFKNGMFLGHAYNITEKIRRKAYYPHISLRNMAVEVNFGQELEFCPIVSEVYELASAAQQQQKPDGMQEEETLAPLFEAIQIADYKFLDEAEVAHMEICPEPPQSFKECIMIMLIGLPCSGKTSYAHKFAERNYKRNYQIIGTFELYEHIISTVRIPYLKQNILTLMEICSDLFQKLLKLASRMRRNFIIDQCNVFLKSRKEKLELFKEFRKDAYVIVLTDKEYSKRLAKRQHSLFTSGFLYPKISMENVRYLKENFVLPGPEEFDGIKYIALDEEKARQAIILTNQLAKSQVHPLIRRKKYKKIIETTRTRPLKPTPRSNQIPLTRPLEGLLTNFMPQMPVISLFSSQASSFPKETMTAQEGGAGTFDVQSILEKKKAMKATLLQNQRQLDITSMPDQSAYIQSANATTLFQSPAIINPAISHNNVISPYKIVGLNTENTASPLGQKFFSPTWANQNLAAQNFTNFINSMPPIPTGNLSTNLNPPKETESNDAKLIRQYELLKSQLQPPTISFGDQSQNTKKT